jgi:hypothetical protein
VKLVPKLGWTGSNPEPGKVFFLAYWLLAPVPIEDARDYARSVKDTPQFEQSRNERKKVEMRFAHLKINHRFERMRLRGLTDARDEFHLAAIVPKFYDTRKLRLAATAGQASCCLCHISAVPQTLSRLA